MQMTSQELTKGTERIAKVSANAVQVRDRRPSELGFTAPRLRC